MRNASLRNLKSTTLATSSAHKPQHSTAPHLYRPDNDAGCRDIAALFNLKRRPGYYNTEAKAALLRRSKEPPHDELLVSFVGAEVEIALTAAGVSLLAGDWTWQATAGGEPLASAGSWSALRWQSEKSFDYLELELPLQTPTRSVSEGRWRLIRQVLLARDDRFLLLADSLLGPQADPVEIRYSCSLPFASGAKLDAARETREGWLTSDKRPRATVIPPALPEWRGDFCHADLTADKERVTLQHATLGRNLYAPLWIDLDPHRLNRSLTWRRLTVGENRAAVTRDAAVAYRIQVGRQQWLFYRSLAKAANRTVIGYNTLQSFVCGRIKDEGQIEDIVTVD